MIGKNLGPYNILEEIGKGGMATVYRAYQTSIERDVAVKVIKHSIVSENNALVRFQREARLIARLEHPHILPVYDFDGAHEPPYIVMRYLEGGTLKEIMKQGHLPLPEVTYLMRQVCSAVDYAHRQGIIHRDLKPSNIMIDHEGNAFVTDFGIARIAASEGKQITETGAVIGTPDYMSPEQAMGKDDIDHRTDIYALGVMTYEMLTGELPFQNESAMGVLMMHMSFDIPLPTHMNPDLPEAIDTVIERAMTKDRQDRYASAVEFAEALTQVLGGTLTSQPTRLREAAGTSIMRRIGANDKDNTDSRSTPSEQQKQVTVVYINAAEFSELAEAEAADPVAIRNQLWASIEKIIQEHGGTVDNQSGDNLLAIWGVQTVHEDDAEQAVRAAVAIQGAVAELCRDLLAEDDNEALPIQIGVHSGMALLTRSNDTGSYKASGTTINTANRLERSAPAGGILISQDAYNHTRGVFLVEGLAPVRFRGSKDAIQVYLVKGIKARAFRSSVQSVEGIETRTIGREAEIKLLTEAMEAAMEDHETQVITIVGDAGTGKTRLLFELTEWEEKLPTDFWYFPAHCTPQMVNQPFGLLREVLTYRFQVQDSDSLSLVQEKFEQGVERFMAANSQEAAHLMAYLVGFNFPNSPYLLNRDAQQLNTQGQRYVLEFFTVVSQLVEGASGSQMSGLMLTLENIHWADERSLDLFNQLIEDHPNLPIAMICTARPALYDRRPNWGSGQDFHERIDLRPLSKRDSRKLVREILQKVEDVPDELRDLIVDRSEGNPFYMEELVKILVEDHVILKGDDVWLVEIDRLANVRVPTTLNGLIQARLDSLLVDERTTLQRASVIGRVFWESTVKAMQAADNINVDVARALNKLIDRELVQMREETTFAGEKEYIFKSTMLHDVVYNSILKRQQRDYHLEVGTWLAAHSEGRSEYDALIAEHYEISGEDVEATRYFYRAGQQAQQINAYNEAIRFYERGQKLIAGQMAEDARRLQVMIGNQLGVVMEEQGRYSEGESLLSASLPIARELADTELIMNLLNTLGTTTFRQGKYNVSMTYLEEALAMGRHLNHRAGMIQALMWLGSNHSVFLQNYEADKDYLQEALVMAAHLDNQNLIARIHNMLGENNRYQAHYQESIAHYEQALAIYTRLDNQYGIMLVNCNLGHATAASGASAAAYQHYYTVFRVAQDMGVLNNPMQESIAGIATLKAASDDADRALALLGMMLNLLDLGEETKLITDPVLAHLREKLGDEAVAKGLERGKSLDWETVVQELLDESPDR